MSDAPPDDTSAAVAGLILLHAPLVTAAPRTRPAWLTAHDTARKAAYRRRTAMSTDARAKAVSAREENSARETRTAALVKAWDGLLTAKAALNEMLKAHATDENAVRARHRSEYLRAKAQADLEYDRAVKAAYEEYALSVEAASQTH